MPHRYALLLPLAAHAPLLAADPPPAAPPKELPAPRGYVCFRAPVAPTIDGWLDDAAWRAAP